MGIVTDGAVYPPKLERSRQFGWAPPRRDAGRSPPHRAHAPATLGAGWLGGPFAQLIYDTTRQIFFAYTRQILHDGPMPDTYIHGHHDSVLESFMRALATPADLERFAGAWRTWAAAPDALFVIPNVEVLCRR
jgi:hypothetical protein